jgi:hypothetical protein
MYVPPVETGRPKLYHPVARIDGADYANILSWEIKHFAKIQLLFTIHASPLTHRCTDCSTITSIISSRYMLSGLRRNMVFSVQYLRCCSGQDTVLVLLPVYCKGYKWLGCWRLASSGGFEIQFEISFITNLNYQT